MPDWSAAIPLRGAGGEPIDLPRTLLSHGVADLPPNAIAPDGSELVTVLAAGDRAWLRPPDRGERRTREARDACGCRHAPGQASGSALLAQVRHMLRLDDDLSAFYRSQLADPLLAWTVTGAGRMLRSPTVFEDLVKTICTTNCAWSATVRMVSALVAELGTPAVGAPERRSFPSPAAMAAADDAFYRDVARAGYRGPYLRTLADRRRRGPTGPRRRSAIRSLPDEEVAERLLAVAGVGPYAAAHMMMLLGRYRRLILDSWTRPKYRRVAGRPRVTDKGIERAFRRYREFAGLAFWLTLTEDWLTEAQAP